MDRFAEIPRSAPEAAAKLRCGLAECALFMAGAPLSALVALDRAALVAATRLRILWECLEGRAGRFAERYPVTTSFAAYFAYKLLDAALDLVNLPL